MSILHNSDKVQRHVRLLISGRDFEAANNLEMSLGEIGRLLCHFLSHSRVVRCDFSES